MTSRGDSLTKRIEMAARRLLTRSFSRHGQSIFVDNPSPALPLGNNPSVLLLRQDKIGDALISMPVIRALRTKFPNAKIDILLGDANYDIRHALGNYINDALLYSKNPKTIIPLIKDLRKRRYDVAVDLMDNASTTSTVITRNCRALYAVGIEKSNAAVYSHIVPLLDSSRFHIVERIAQLLLPFDINPKVISLDLEYAISQEDKQSASVILSKKQDQFLLGINISSSAENRMWSEQHWIELIQHLKQKMSGVRIIGFSLPAHRASLMNIAAATQAEPAPESDSFHRFATLLSLCDGIVTPDTSVVHLASAWKTPCVAFFVQNNPNVLPWAPYNSPHRTIIAAKDIREISPQEAAKICWELFVRDKS